MQPPSDEVPPAPEGPSPSERLSASDKELLEACIAGRRCALDTLFTRYWTDIFRTVKHAIRSRRGLHISGDAEDLSQEVCLAITHDPNRLQWIIDKDWGLTPGIRRTAHLMALKTMKDDALRWPDVTTELESEKPDELLDRHDEPDPMIEMLIPFLNRLDDECLAFAQAYCGLPPFSRSLSVPEIAVQFGWSRAKAYRCYKELREKIRQFYEEPYIDEDQEEQDK